MTVASQVNKVTYNGNGSVKVWPYSFRVLEAAHLKVVVTDSLGDEITLSAGYSVDLLNSTVTYPISGDALAAGSKITLIRELPLIQNMDLENQGPLEAEALERAYDALTMICQQLDERSRRAILGPISGDDPPADIVAKLLAASVSAQQSAEGALATLAALNTLYDDVLKEIAFNGAEIGTPKIFKTGEQSDGYLLMNGSAYSTTDYTDLADVLGVADLPDWRTSHALPSGWSWYIKGKHAANVVGQIKRLRIVVHSLSAGASAYCTYDASQTLMDLYIPQGAQGPQGPTGPTGPVGPQGPAGEQGPRGIQGPQGEQGERGQEGAQGVKGDTGLQGPTGPQGPQGNKGPQGNEGPRGIQGPAGEQGPIGITGPQGPQGEQGDRGIPGPEGLKGPSGDKGPDGEAPLGLAFGSFSFDTDGHLVFSVYGINSSEDVSAEFDSAGHVILTFTSVEGE